VAVRIWRRLSVPVAACAAALGAAGPAHADGTYVALGDSVAAPPGSYVHLLFDALRADPDFGTDTLYNRARGGESSGSLRTGGQLATAIADIDRPSDTKIVTIDIGGNDRAACGGPPPTWHLSSCAFASNFDASIADLRAALKRDPGEEPLVAMAYFNPASGTGSVQERNFDAGLLGTDHELFCAPPGDPRLGLNDRITCITRDHGAFAADVYADFKLGGQALMADGLHPNGDGQAVIAHRFAQAVGVPFVLPPRLDWVAPTLRRVRVRPRSFLPMRRRGSIAAARGATVSYSLSEPATVRFRVMRVAAGRLRARGSFTHRGDEGGNRFTFTGRVDGRRLRPGRYRLVARARDRGGNVSNRVRTPFVIRSRAPGR
jgi:lysophospholipase L1-like esterase